MKIPNVTRKCEIIFIYILIGKGFNGGIPYPISGYVGRKGKNGKNIDNKIILRYILKCIFHIDITISLLK